MPAQMSMIVATSVVFVGISSYICCTIMKYINYQELYMYVDIS